jgi:DNA-binding FrmR family transcriptional regulator
MAGWTGYWEGADLVRRLDRIAGQVRGIEGMMARGEECASILMQVAAVAGAIAAVERIIFICQIAESVAAKPREMASEAAPGERPLPVPARPF